MHLALRAAFRGLPLERDLHLVGLAECVSLLMPMGNTALTPGLKDVYTHIGVRGNVVNRHGKSTNPILRLREPSKGRPGCHPAVRSRTPWQRAQSNAIHLTYGVRDCGGRNPGRTGEDARARLDYINAHSQAPYYTGVDPSRSKRRPT